MRLRTYWHLQKRPTSAFHDYLRLLDDTYDSLSCGPYSLKLSSSLSGEEKIVWWSIFIFKLFKRMTVFIFASKTFVVISLRNVCVYTYTHTPRKGLWAKQQNIISQFKVFFWQNWKNCKQKEYDLKSHPLEWGLLIWFKIHKIAEIQIKYLHCHFCIMWWIRFTRSSI